MTYDVFISYRREKGLERARILGAQLKSLGVKVFLDLDEIRTGPFNEKIYQSIDEARYVLFVMTAGALDRCANDGDWVRNELEYAHEKQKVIVPVCSLQEEISFPEKLPDSLHWIRLVNVARIDYASMFETTVKNLVREYLPGVEIRDREQKNRETFLKRARRFKYNDYLIDAQERAELNKLARELGMDVSTREELIEQVESEFDEDYKRSRPKAGRSKPAPAGENGVFKFLRQFAGPAGENALVKRLRQFAPFDGFLKAIRRAFDFRGVSGRAELWGFALVCLILFVLSFAVDVCLDEENMIATFSLSLLLSVPYVSLFIRRTRDCGLSPWFAILFLGAGLLVPIVGGLLVLLYLGLRPGKAVGSNECRPVLAREGGPDEAPATGSLR